MNGTMTPKPFPTPPKGEEFEVQVSIQQEDGTGRIRLRFVTVCWEPLHPPIPPLVPGKPRGPRRFRVWELGTFEVPDSLALPGAEALAVAALERLRDQVTEVVLDPAFSASRRAGLEDLTDRVTNPFPALMHPVEVAHG